MKVAKKKTHKTNTRSSLLNVAVNEIHCLVFLHNNNNNKRYISFFFISYFYVPKTYLKLSKVLEVLSTTEFISIKNLNEFSVIIKYILTRQFTRDTFFLFYIIELFQMILGLTHKIIII